MKRILGWLLKILIVGFIAIALTSGCAVEQQPVGDNFGGAQKQAEETELPTVTQKAANYVEVKYRSTPVNLFAQGFEYHNTDASSFIRGAWYDKQNRYLVMNIDGTYYNYCGVPEFVWRGFKESESYGRFFNASIKESFEYKNCIGPDY
jgi:hypothetical protein